MGSLNQTCDQTVIVLRKYTTTPPEFSHYKHQSLEDEYSDDPEVNVTKFMDSVGLWRKDLGKYEELSINLVNAIKDRYQYEGEVDELRMKALLHLLNVLASFGVELPTLRFIQNDHYDGNSQLWSVLHEAAHGFDLSILDELSVDHISDALSTRAYSGSYPFVWTNILDEARALRIQSRLMRHFGVSPYSADHLTYNVLDSLVFSSVADEEDDLASSKDQPPDLRETYAWFFDANVAMEKILAYYEYLSTDAAMNRRTEVLAETILRLPSTEGVSTWDLLYGQQVPQLPSNKESGHET